MIIKVMMSIAKSLLAKLKRTKARIIRSVWFNKEAEPEKHYRTELREKVLKQIPSDPRKTKQLHSILKLAVGERTEISLNTRTDDGMTNGAANVIKPVQIHQSGKPSVRIFLLYKLFSLIAFLSPMSYRF